MLFTLQKVWLYIKKYWWLFLALVVTVAVALGGKAIKSRSSILLDILQTKKEYHENEIDVINRTRAKEVNDIKIATEVYASVLARIDDEHIAARTVIEQRRKKIIERIVSENINDSNTLAKELAEEYGFELVEVSND